MILDAVHIYNVANVVDRDRPFALSIVCSEDGMNCALLINGYPHAAFNFAKSLLLTSRSGTYTRTLNTRAKRTVREMGTEWMCGFRLNLRYLAKAAMFPLVYER